MTEFTHEPMNKIIIKNLVHETIENLLYECYVNRFTEVFWIDGMMILTRRFASDGGEKEYEDMTNGIKYFEKITFVKLPKYVSSLKWKDGGNFDLRLLNYSNDSKFRNIAKWIKSQPIWNETLEEQK